MSRDNFRERAIELRGFINEYLARLDDKPNDHTKKTLEFIDDFLAADPQFVISSLHMSAGELDARLASIVLPEAVPTDEHEPNPQPDELPDQEEDPAAASEVANSAPEVEPAKKKRGWTEEQRAAAAERMRARQAAGMMKGRKKGTDSAPLVEPVTSGDPENQPRPLVSSPSEPHRLTVAHPGYAGKREDGQLTDSDWPDIKSRLSRGDTKAAIASDYDVEEIDLDFFISSAQRREAKTPPGEALAPLPIMAGGAV